MTQIVSSPTSPVSNKGRGAVNISDAVALDAPIRTEPIHPMLPSIRLPKSTDSSNATLVNPITLKPFSAEDLKQHNFVALKDQYKTPEDARFAQEEALRELKERMEESERKTREVEREMEEKEKTREIERKLYKQKLGKDMG